MELNTNNEAIDEQPSTVEITNLGYGADQQESLKISNVYQNEDQTIKTALNSDSQTKSEPQGETVDEKSALNSNMRCSDANDSQVACVNSKRDPISDTESATNSLECTLVPNLDIKIDPNIDVNVKVEPVDDIPHNLNCVQEGEVDSKTGILMSYRQDTEHEMDSGAESDGSSNSSVNIFSDNNINAVSDDEIVGNKKIKAYIPKEIVKTRGELLPEDLPPIEDLKITIAEDEKLLTLGKVSGFVVTLVVIQSSPNTPALNEDTVLFYEDRRVFGKVFEIFGPVASPFYTIRFNTVEDIQNENIQIGDEVYCAPELEDITRYIFVDQLKQMKGSDASWKDNNEPPDKYRDYSDDEAERRSKAKRKEGRKKENEVEENNKNQKNDNAFNRLPGACDIRTSGQPSKGRKKRARQYDRDQPESDQAYSSGNTNIWNCWPPGGNMPPRHSQRPPPPRNGQNYGQNTFISPASFNPRPWRPENRMCTDPGSRPALIRMGGTWNTCGPFQNGGMNHWAKSNPVNFNCSNNSTNFNPSNNPTNFNPSNNPTNFNPRSPFSNQMPRQMHMHQSFGHHAPPGATIGTQNLFLNNSQQHNVPRPMIMDSRFIQNNQMEDSQIGNPYSTGLPQH